MKKFAALLLAALMTLGLVSCSSTTVRSEGYTVTTSEAPQSGLAEPELAAVEDSQQDSASFLTESTVLSQSDAKLIYTGTVNLQTTDFSGAAQAIESLLEDYDGYVESQTVYQNVTYRSASYTLRVPGESYYAFLNALGESDVCTVTYRSTQVEDVSEDYADVENRLNTLEIKLARLQELLAQADSVEDLITIESAITDVESQIETLTGQKNRYDSLIHYSTVYVELRETAVAGEGVNATLSDRLYTGFVKGVRGFASDCADALVWIVSHLIGVLIFLAVVVAVIVLLVRMHRRHLTRKAQRRARKEERRAQKHGKKDRKDGTEAEDTPKLEEET